jgi:hypothetical protein
MADDVEGRELAQGKTGEQTRVRTQCRSALPRALDRIRQAARRDHVKPMTALWHHVDDINRRREAYDGLNRDAAPGVEGQTWAADGENREANLRDRSGKGRTTPALSSGGTSRSRRAASGPSASRPWQIRSSSGPRWRC